MDADFVTRLEQTLRQVTAPNSQTIKAASAALQTQFYVVPQVIPALVHLLQTHPDTQIRQLAGVEVRKQVPKFWSGEEGPGLNDAERESIRSSILTSTLQEQNALVRHTSSRVISAIAKIDLEEAKWPQLLPALFLTCKSGSAAEREVGVYVLLTLLEAETADLVEGAIELLHLFGETIRYTESLQVRVTSVQALGCLGEYIGPTDKEAIELFRRLVPLAVEVLKQVITEGDDKMAQQVFEVFADLLVLEPALISKHFKDLVTFMINDIAVEKRLSPDFRRPALRFILLAVQFRKNKLQSLKFGSTITQAAVQILSEPHEDEDDDDDEEDEDDLEILALRTLDALSQSLPPSQVVAPLLSVLPQLTGSPDKNQRRAGFLGLKQVVEGSPDFIAANIDDLLPLVIKGLGDEDLPVKVSALQALAQLAIELRDIVGAHHEVLLPLVFGIMDSASSLKVGKSACLALDAVLETLDSKVITERYLSALVPKLLHLLSATSDLQLKGSIVAAISSAIFAAGRSYVPYFESTIHALEPFVTLSLSATSTTDDEQTLCGISIDALSSLVAAVGKDTFRPYVQSLADASYKCLQSDQSRLRECGVVFLGSLARTYEAEFTPFLALIMPEFLKTLQQEDYSQNDGDEGDEVIGADEQGEGFNVNSALVLEKELMLGTLGDFIEATKSDFVPYLEESVKCLLDACGHFYDGIRSTALSSLWRGYITFYKVAANGEKWKAGFPVTAGLPEPAATLGAEARKVTLLVLSGEDDRGVATVICDSLIDAIRTSGPVILGDQEDLEALCSELILLLSKSHSSQVSIDDFDDVKQDEEDDEEQAEYDEALMDNALGVVVQLAAALGPQFTQLFPTFLGLTANLCKSKSSSERTTGIGALAEIINEMKEAVKPWTSQLLEMVMRGLDDSDMEVRSNAAYGAGLLAFYSGDDTAVQGSYMKILQKLQRLLKKVDKKKRREDDEDNSARSLANACGCVARLSMRHPELVPLGEVIPVLVSRLPLEDGYEENTPIFEFIIALFEQRNEQVIELREHVVAAVAAMLTKQHDMEAEQAQKSTIASVVLPFEDEAIKAKVVNLLKFLEQGQPGLASSHAVLKPYLV